MDPSEQSIRILQDIITRYGPPTETNILMYRGLMQDLLVDYTRELNLLKLSLEQGLVFRLMKEGQHLPFEVLLHQMVGYLHSNFGIDESAATWSIEAWAEALGIYQPLVCIADFSLEPARGEAPLPVQFSNTSRGDITGFVWDFGDGESSGESDPVHVYRTPGTFTVTLRAFHDALVSEKTRDNAVEVGYPLLDAGIQSNTDEGEIPLTVRFTCNLQEPMTFFDWDLGDGEHSPDPSPVHTYQQSGVYQVSLTVSDGNSLFRVKRTRQVTVTPRRVHAAFSSAPSDPDHPLSMVFTDESRGDIAGIYWEFGDGAVSEERDPVHEFAAPGVYPVTVTVTGKDGETNSVTREIPLDHTVNLTVSDESGDTPGDTPPIDLTSPGTPRDSEQGAEIPVSVPEPENTAPEPETDHTAIGSGTVTKQDDRMSRGIKLPDRRIIGIIAIVATIILVCAVIITGLYAPPLPATDIANKTTNPDLPTVAPTLKHVQPVRTGAISIAVEGDNPYTWGREIRISGKNTAGNTTYLFFVMKGNHQADPDSIINLGNPPGKVSPDSPRSFTSVPVQATDHSWSYAWNISSDELQRVSGYVYAVNTPVSFSDINRVIYAKTQGISIGAKPRPDQAISGKNSPYDDDSSSSDSDSF